MKIKNSYSLLVAVFVIIHIDNIAMLIKNRCLPYSKEDVMAYFYFASDSINTSELSVVFINLLPFFIASFLLGNIISDDLKGTGIYIIIRQKKRISWLYRKIVEINSVILLETVIFMVVIYFLSYMWIDDMTGSEIILELINHAICIYYIIIIFSLVVCKILNLQEVKR